MKAIKKGDWVINIETGRVGVAVDDPVEVGVPKEGLSRVLVSVAYPAQVRYVYGGKMAGSQSNALPIIEVLTTALAVMRLLEEIIPVAETIWAALVRMWKATFGTQEEKMAVAAFKEAKKAEKDLRNA